MNLVRLLPRFRAADQALTVFSARECWLRIELEAFQLERINLLWRHATEYVPYYVDLQRQRDMAPEFSSLEDFRAQVPLLTKDDLRREGRRLLSTAAERGSWCRSSGSTGTPTTAFWGNTAKRESLQAKYRFYASWNIDYFDRCAFVWGNQAAPDESNWARPWHNSRRWAADRLRNRLRIAPDRLTPAVLRKQLKRLAAFRPAVLYAYTTSAYLLAQEAAAIQFHCPSLKLVNYSAEPGLPRLVEAIEAGFGVPAISEYGSAECGFIAGEDRMRRLRVRDDIVFLETLPRTGGRYDIVVTPLTNPSFPLLRYHLGDTTTAPLARHERGLSVLADVAGRIGDFLVSARGDWLNSELVERLFENQPWVRRFTVHQQASGATIARVETAAPAAAGQVELLGAQLSKLLGGYSAAVELYDELPAHASGKHRWITSDKFTPASLAAAEQAACAATQ